MPTPNEAADILRRFLAVPGPWPTSGTDIALPRDQDIALPRDLTPLDTNRLPPSSQSDADFEQQVINESAPRRNPRTLPFPIFDPANSLHTDPVVRVNPLDTNRLPERGDTPAGATSSGRAALVRMFGIQPDPPDPAESAARLTDGAMRADDPLTLAGRRYDERQALRQRIDNETAAAAMAPLEGYVPGEPGRRFVSRQNAGNLVADTRRRDQLLADEAQDPFTGAAETARVGTIQKALDTAAATERPEIASAAKTVAERNAFAEFLKAKGVKMGELTAAGSPEAYAAALTPIRAAGSAENQAVLDAAGQRAVDVADAKTNKGVHYTAPEQQLLDAANSVQDLGPKLLSLLEAAHPGIGSDPTKFGSWTDLLGSEIGGAIYRRGKTKTALSDQIDQMVGYLEAQIPRMLVPGRVNQQQYDDLKLHAPRLGFSDGANYERLHTMLTKILPGVLHGMDEAHGADATSPAVPGLAGDGAKLAPPTPDEIALGASMSPADMWKLARQRR